MKRIWLALLLLAAASARAQGTFGTLVGRATSQGRPLAAATVTLNSDVLQATRTTTTGPNGTYWFGALPPGEYEVTFSAEGMQTVSRKADVRLAETSRVDAELEPSTEGETVTVTTRTRAVLEEPRLTSVFEAELIDELPHSRRIEEVALLGLECGSASSRFRKAAACAAALQIDGVPGTETVEDAILQTTVITGGAGVEYDEPIIVTAVTRSGGNDFSASARLTHTEDDTKGEATLGGPIRRDALWFFLAGEGGSEHGLLAKGTASLARQTLVATYFRGDDDARGSADYTLLPNGRTIVHGRAGEGTAAIRGFGFVPTRFGDHELLAGVDDDAFFVSDTFRIDRGVVTLGLRDDEIRAGMVLHLGAQRVSASYRHDELALAWARRLFANGYLRVNAIDRDGDRRLEADLRAQYLIFHGGATFSRSMANVWIAATPPSLDNKLTISLLGRHRHGESDVDLALLYRFTRFAVEPFAKVEVLEAKDFRFSIGARY